MESIGDYCYDVHNDIIGEGAFGTVFKARHLENNERIVAIKTINLLKSSVKSISYEFLDREITILQKLSENPHPNLVHLLQFERKPTMIYLIMEFCNGGDFNDYLKTKKILDESTIQLFFNQIATGINFLHDKNILHRDLKPENIILCFAGDRYPVPTSITLKLADFGIGRFLPSDGLAGTICGTLLYMAPEIRQGKQYGFKVDVWSIGVIMLQCLTGSLQGVPDFTNVQLPQNTSQTLRDLILKCLLVHDPDQRIECRNLLNHKFFGKTIQVSVRGPGGGTNMIPVNDNDNVDTLITNISSVFSLRSEPGSMYLIYDGKQLEYGSSGSIKELGISHGSNVEFCQRLPGGGRLQS